MEILGGFVSDSVPPGTEIGSQLRRGRSVSIVGVRHRCGAGSIPEPRGGLIQTSVISTSTLPRIALEQMPCIVRLPDMRHSDKMKTNTMKAAVTANSIELKNENRRNGRFTERCCQRSGSHRKAEIPGWLQYEAEAPDGGPAAFWRVPPETAWNSATARRR